MKKLILALLLTGTALAQQTINGVANQSVTGTSGSVSYSNYGGVNTFGDSITQGTGSGTAFTSMQQGINATAYANMLIADFGGNGQNYGYGGDQAADMSVKVYGNANPAVSNNFITTIMIGTNDVNVYGTDTNKQNIYLRSLEAAIAWAGIPDAYKVSAKDTNFCSRTGTWTVDSGALRGGDIYSVTAGSSLSCSITVPSSSHAIIYGYTACDGFSPGSASILIDGSSPSNDATVYSYGQSGAAIATSNGGTCARFVSIYSVSPGSHTLSITTANSGVVEPEWLGTPFIDTTSTAPPVVYVAGVPWNQGNSPSTTTATYNTIASTAVSTLNGVGTPVYFVDIRNGTNTRNSNTTTPLNSTTDYSGGVQGDITCPASWLNPYHPNSSPYWSRSCGHGHLAANFETAIGVKAGGPQGSSAVMGRTLAPAGFHAPLGASDYGFGFSANGDMRVGWLAGWHFDGTNMHYATPLTTACHYFDFGNSPSSGVSPTIVTSAVLCKDYPTFYNYNTASSSVGYSGVSTLAPNLPQFASIGVNYGQSVTSGNVGSSKFVYYGNSDAQNYAWYGVVVGSSGSTPGICVSSSRIGFGYTESNLFTPCPSSGDSVQMAGNTTVHGALTATSFNGVALSNAGLSTTFLDGTGHYSAPTGSSGVTSINGTAGAYTFTGSGVSCALATCTFSGGGGGASYPLTIVQEGAFDSGVTNASSYTVTFPAALAASGNTAFLVVATDGSQAITIPSGWTADINQAQASYSRVMLLHKATAGDTSATFTVGTATSFSAYFFEISGSHALDHSAVGGSSNSNAVVLPSITPTSGSAVFGAACFVMSGTQNDSPTKATVDPISPNWKTRTVAVPFATNGGRSLVLTSGTFTATATSTAPPPLTVPNLSLFTSGGVAYMTFSIL